MWSEKMIKAIEARKPFVVKGLSGTYLYVNGDRPLVYITRYGEVYCRDTRTLAKRPIPKGGARHNAIMSVISHLILTGGDVR